MLNPKCPKCEISEHVVLVNTATKVATGVGAVAGGIMGAFAGASGGALAGQKAGQIFDESRKLYKCNNCDKEFQG